MGRGDVEVPYVGAEGLGAGQRGAKGARRGEGRAAGAGAGAAVLVCARRIM